MAAISHSDTLAICPFDRLKCPACGNPIFRAEAWSGITFKVCEGQVTVDGRARSCSVPLVIIATDGGLATVVVVPVAERNRLRDELLQHRRKAG